MINKIASNCSSSDVLAQIDLEKPKKFKGIIKKLDVKGWDTKPPGLVAFDADSTLINATEHNHWWVIIRDLPQEVQDRIMQRANTFGSSEDSFDQQYLSAASFFELQRLGFDSSIFKKYAPNVDFRDGSKEVMKFLIKKGFKVVIISYGIKLMLQECLKYLGFEDQIEVYANEILNPQSGQIAPGIKNFIPSTSEEAIRNDPSIFTKFVKSLKVIPNTKGTILKEIVRSGNLCDKKIMVVGDSWGDYTMFKEAQSLNGHSILHIHNDQRTKTVLDSNTIEQLIAASTYLSINLEDTSFEPTKSLIESLV
jgi:HAD superfamily phosphoserine phosphatase-like hydrolase